MRKINQLYNKWSVRVYTLGILILIFGSCVYLDSIDYESTLTAGEVAGFTMNIRIEPLEESADTRLVIGYLVPKSWDAAGNTVVTYTSDIDEGIKTMSLIPEDELPKNAGGLTWSAALKNRYDVGPNVLDDMEWIVYWSDEVYTVTNGENINAAVTLKTQVGPENMRVKLGFFVNHTNDGLSTNTDHYKVMYTDCIEVVDGEGSLIDFCQLHLNSAQPSSATKDDIITIKYNGNIAANALDDSEKIYLCATAYTDNGNTYDECDISDKTRMIKETEYGRTFSLTFWPAGFFNIPEDETISRIDYSFLNEDGSIELMDSEVPFTYEFSCK